MSSKKNLKASYILDTSVLLEDSGNLFLLSEDGTNEIILPETVLDEIDNKKKGFEDVNFQAREFNRLLDKFKIISTKSHKDKDLNEVIMQYEKVKIRIFSKNSYNTTYSKDLSSIYNDRKILEICKEFPKSKLITNDIALRIRAASLGMNSEPLKKDRIENIDEIKFIEELHIESIDKDYLESSILPSDFGKEFSDFTNIEFVCDDTGEHILATYKFGHFHIIDERKLRKLPVQPRNREQIFFLNMLLDKDLPIVVCAGVTGSGKNLLSLQGALKYQQQYSDTPIKYCRNTITAGDQNAQLGFLKGDENQKLGVFTYPLHDAISSYKKIEEEYNLTYKKKTPVMSENEFLEHHLISTININQMRGVNLNGYLIFDEWQNSSPSVNKLMMTRISEGSKVVIIGDINQIDHPYLSKFNNALSIMLKQAKTSNIIGAITMSKVLRGKIADYADKNL